MRILAAHFGITFRLICPNMFDLTSCLNATIQTYYLYQVYVYIYATPGRNNVFPILLPNVSTMDLLKIHYFLNKMGPFNGVGGQHVICDDYPHHK